MRSPGEAKVKKQVLTYGRVLCYAHLLPGGIKLMDLATKAEYLSSIQLQYLELVYCLSATYYAMILQNQGSTISFWADP